MYEAMPLKSEASKGTAANADVALIEFWMSW